MSGAMEALPTLSLTTTLEKSAEQVSHTGTGGGEILKLAPLLAPGTAQRGHPESIPVTVGKVPRPGAGVSAASETSPEPKKKASLPGFGNEAVQRARRDLNPQPPDRQSGALTN